ncbi:MAG TPA: bile acid:sodium symporter, partial [Burkholderiaceae bacterium]
MKRPSFVPDNFTLALVGVVMLASIAPAQGGVARFFDGFTAFAIGLLFFL